MSVALTRKSTKLITLCEEQGYHHVHALLKEVMADSVVPGICRNPECSYVGEVEPDQRAGFCENCSDNTVTSALILAGVI